jgi:Mce-associated membrane protein
MAEPAGAPTEQLTEPTDDDTNDDDTNGGDTHDTPVEGAPPRKMLSRNWVAALVCVALIAALAGLAGWFGWRSQQSRAAQDQRALFLQAGRQAAVNLTTIDWQHAEGDVQRILDSATGSFRDDFAARSQPFIDLVKQSKSTTVGTISEAGLESTSGNSAQVIVAVSVRTSNEAAPQQDPRSWRMRIDVESAGGQTKVSNVEFVP